jgi:hypothetical protein
MNPAELASMTGTPREPSPEQVEAAAVARQIDRSVFVPAIRKLLCLPIGA